MTKRLRTAILIIFLTAFVAAAPAVILYTSGYRYNWKKQHLEKTGSLDLDSQPNDAAVTLNDVLQSKTTPLSIWRLLSEEYRIRIAKSGYLPWEKKLEIRSGETTFAKDVILFRDVPQQLLRDTSPGYVSISRDGGKVAWVQSGEQGTELYYQDLRTPQPILLSRLAPGFYEVFELYWSPDGRRLLMQTDVSYSLYTVSTAEYRLLDGIFPEDTLSIHWSVDGSLVAIADSGIHAYDPDNNALKLVGRSRFISYATPAGCQENCKRIPQFDYVVDATMSDNEVIALRTKPGGYGELTLGSTNPDQEPRVLASVDLHDRRGIVDVIDRIVFIGSPFGNGGSFSAYDLNDGKLLGYYEANNVAKLTGKNSDQPLPYLFCSGSEITVADPRQDQRMTVTRLGKRIGDCAWHPSGKWIVFSTDDGISAIELDGRGDRNVVEFAQARLIDAFSLNPDGTKLIFAGIGEKEQGIFERDL